MTDAIAAPVEGQAAQSQPVAAAPQQAAPAATSWVDSLDPQAKDYVGVKGFKDPASVVTAYKNLEALRGVPAEQLLKLPKDMSDPAAMGEVFDKLGRPPAADKYTRALGEGFDDNVFKGIADKAHSLGLTDTQFKGLQEVTAGLAGQLQEQQDKASAAAFDAWKSQNPDGFQNAARAMAQAGVDEAALEGILSGDKTALYGFLASVAKTMGEPAITQGATPGGSSFQLTPSQAKAKIAELMADDTFSKGYNNRSQAIRQPFIAKLEELHKIAAGGR